MRMASNDPDAAVGQLNDRWDRALPPDLAVWAWAEVGKQAAQKLQPEAADYYLKASQRAAKAKVEVELTDDLHAWKARAALRAHAEPVQGVVPPGFRFMRLNAYAVGDYDPTKGPRYFAAQTSSWSVG